MKALLTPQSRSNQSNASNKEEMDVDDDDDMKSSTAPTTKETAKETETAKFKSFRKIMKVAKTDKATKCHQYCAKYMKFDSDEDCVVCKCDTKVWTTKRHRKGELFRHFDRCKSVADTKCASQGVLKRLIRGTKDTFLTPLNYIYLYATFVALWFIIYHRLSLNLLFSLNVILSFLNVTTTGNGYIKYGFRYEDYVPPSFQGLIPSTGVLTGDEIKEYEFICEHEDKLKSEFIMCNECERLCCLKCLKSIFHIAKACRNSEIENTEKMIGNVPHAS